MRPPTLIFILFCVSCGIRTSSEDRFKANIGFALPTDKKVLKDDFYDMAQDYELVYVIELSTRSNKELINQIKPYVGNKGKECNWSLSENGFKYQCEKDLILYQVNYDTLARRIIYSELAD